eukprot:GHVT01005183.1.p1 GENE.GHVT01005183.1~~GHVT01005183.1.p1  ORF type:complete len:423 (-),score=78.61 GHVT01005183.1:79-1347(-)
MVFPASATRVGGGGASRVPNFPYESAAGMPSDRSLCKLLKESLDAGGDRRPAFGESSQATEEAKLQNESKASRRLFPEPVNCCCSSSCCCGCRQGVSPPTVAARANAVKCVCVDCNCCDACSCKISAAAAAGAAVCQCGCASGCCCCVADRDAVGKTVGYATPAPDGGEAAGQRRGEADTKRVVLSTVDEVHRQEAPSQVPGKCLEEVCTCGLHKSQVAPPPIPFLASSSYRTDFVPKAIPPREISGAGASSHCTSSADSCSSSSRCPSSDPAVHPSIPFTSSSSYRSDFAPKALQPRQVPGAIHPPTTIPFAGSSAYSSDFSRKPLPLPTPVPHLPTHQSIPFVATSSYRSDFMNKELPPVVVASAVSKPPCIPFVGTTSNRDDYSPKQLVTCPLNRMPKPPIAQFPNSHVFWDEIARKWY